MRGIKCIVSIIIITCFKHDTDWLHVAFNMIQQLQNLFLLFLKWTAFIHKKLQYEMISYRAPGLWKKRRNNTF